MLRVFEAEQARLPNFLVPPLSLQPDVPLMEAAARMAVMTNGALGGIKSVQGSLAPAFVTCFKATLLVIICW